MIGRLANPYRPDDAVPIGPIHGASGILSRPVQSAAWGREIIGRILGLWVSMDRGGWLFVMAEDETLLIHGTRWEVGGLRYRDGYKGGW